MEIVNIFATLNSSAVEDLDYLFLTPLANSEVSERPQFAFAGIAWLESRLNILRAAIFVT